MKKRTVVVAALALLLFIIVVFPSKIASAGDSSQPQDLKSVVSALRDSLKDVQQQLDQLKLQAPGLGEYMTTIQLHAAKLWFAVGASNWELASYELDEMSETMDGARALHVFKNGLDVSGVLQSVQETQIPLMHQAIASKASSTFTSAYGETLDACNSCHRSAGYGFISIMPPTAPPVTNQRWDVH
jgi:cytochrome c553